MLALAQWWGSLMALSPRAQAVELVAIPAGQEADLRFFESDGRQLDGIPAFRRMADANLTVWAAGNQVFAMTKVIEDFQALHPGLTVALMTLPPGMILKAIQARGWSLDDARLTLHPDVFATVSVTQLRDTSEISNYIVYIHNALELMVSKGNPRHVGDLHDLTRADLRVMLPNPLTEGIMSFYAKPILQRLGLWTALSPGADCAGGERAAHVHFTTVHHRENAIAGGAPVEGIRLPAGQNAADQVEYVAGALRDSPHAAAAAAFIDFLGSQRGQDIYTACGFLPRQGRARTPAAACELRPLAEVARFVLASAPPPSNFIRHPPDGLRNVSVGEAWF
jgi:ABC-type molybdate transport system substrate-binding protein